MKKIAVGICLAILGVMMCNLALAESYPVAVFNFESKDDGRLGEEITDLIMVHLTQNPNLRLVERERLKKVLSEMGLGLTGVVDEDQAVQIGKVVGAKILVTGRVFVTDEELIMVARIIGTETSRVYAESATGSTSGNLTQTTQVLAKKIQATILKKGPDLVAKRSETEDRIEKIRTKIANKQLPKVVATIQEQHIGESSIDPAAETELIYFLKECGFEVLEREEILNKWAREYLEDTGTKIPRGIKADVIIVGEAFSEFGTRRDELVSCKARVEMRAVDKRSGRILAIAREGAVAVDLSSRIAGKEAIVKAAQNLMGEFIPKLVKAWNKKAFLK